MLIEELEGFGKRKVADLRESYAEWVLLDGFSAAVAEAIASGDDILQYNAGPLFSHHIDQGGIFSESDWEFILDGLDGNMHWTCALAICRTLAEHPELLEIDLVAFSAFLHEKANASTSFLRAWAISAFWELGKMYSDYEDEAKAYREQGLKDTAKCVVVRMQKLV
ncbi:hypothetical protein MLD52_07025 [Puniceicoccaceae bacterium K14]|nr:hypothetical protein [Puniceicoccaceae bacterium K14]